MPIVKSVGTAVPPFKIDQKDAVDFVRMLFADSFQDIDRLLKVFQNGRIQSRYFAKDLDWYAKDHSLLERNELYIEESVRLGVEAIESCLKHDEHLIEEIDAIFLISTTGFSTPSLDARIINKLPFRTDVKRIPIWGLGCAGGASGLSRAYDYCLAYPKAKVLVVAIELCSLTFQRADCSKSNLIGTSLFADGAACALVTGDNCEVWHDAVSSVLKIKGTHSAILPESLDVMGWNIKNEGLYVIFSKDIPSIVRTWLKPNTEQFLQNYHLSLKDISHLIAHPGGKKVLDAYAEALDIPAELTSTANQILMEYGNMSSVTILFVLERFLRKKTPAGEWGLAAALGPGFSSELLLMRWES